MKTFDFKGQVSSSKSYYNRCLILSHYKNNFIVHGQSQSRDVLFMQKAINEKSNEIDVGEGGTTLRFLAFLFSRKPGRWNLNGSLRLFSRPQQELIKIFQQMGVKAQLLPDQLIIESEGWKINKEINLDMSYSSQFASGLILNAWNLPFEINLRLSQSRVSDGYLEMTLDLVKKAGMRFRREGNLIHIPPHQSINIDSVHVEADISSAFVIASLAAGRGHCEIDQFPFESLQPDLIFLDHFKK